MILEIQRKERQINAGTEFESENTLRCLINLPSLIYFGKSSSGPYQDPPVFENFNSNAIK